MPVTIGLTSTPKEVKMNSMAQNLNGNSLKKTLGWNLMIQEFLSTILENLRVTAPVVTKAAQHHQDGAGVAADPTANPATCFSTKEDKRNLSRSLCLRIKSRNLKLVGLMYTTMKNKRNTISTLITEMVLLTRHQTVSTKKYTRIILSSRSKMTSTPKNSLIS